VSKRTKFYCVSLISGIISHKAKDGERALVAVKEADGKRLILRDSKSVA